MDKGSADGVEDKIMAVGNRDDKRSVSRVALHSSNAMCLYHGERTKTLKARIRRESISAQRQHARTRATYLLTT